MKIARLLFVLFLVSLSACSTTTGREKNDSARADPETVMVTYRIKSGKEAEFQAVLSQAWEIYRTERLVFAEPHVIVRDNEGDNKTRFIEIFTWVSHATPEHAPDAVKAFWNQEQSLCEARDGHGGLEGGEVDLLAPKHH